MPLAVTGGGTIVAARASGDAGLAGEPGTELKPVPFEEIYLLSGELTAVRSDDLDTPRSDTWRVQVKWLAEDGFEAKAGDRVVEFDNTSIVAGLEEKRLAWLQSEIAMESRAAALEGEAADRRLALDKALNAREKASISADIPAELSRRTDWEAGQLALHRADAEVEKARLQLEAFEIASKSDLEVLRIARDKAARDIAETELRLKAFTLLAPRDGIFIVGENRNEDRKFQVGDTSWPGMSVGSMPDLSEMEAMAFLPDVDDGRIAPGMPARCILDTYPDRSFEARIKTVASIAERNGFRVGVSLVQADPEIMRPGMSVRIEVVRRSWPAALVVPRAAVRREGGRSLVWVAGRAEPVEVVLAACTPTDCVIESGLSGGERLLVR